jgi:hypothetical protein
LADYVAVPYPDSAGLAYIYTYGILQAIFIQQDAIRHLAEAFGLDLTLPEELRRIREIRNSSIGHPTKQKLNGIQNYNFISRISMRKYGFTLLRTSKIESNQFIEVNLAELLDTQAAEALALLGKISEKLAKLDEMHKQKFKGEPLVDKLPPAAGYYFEKMSEGIHSSRHYGKEFAHGMVGIIRKMYDEFESALKERSELHDYTAYDLQEYRSALDWMDRFLSNKIECCTENDAAVYLFYLRERHKHFVEIAKEIDDEYAKT